MPGWLIPFIVQLVIPALLALVGYRVYLAHEREQARRKRYAAHVKRAYELIRGRE